MGLLIPSSGTLFWMVVIFAVVFFILAKYAFPVIIRMVDERKRYIDEWPTNSWHRSNPKANVC